ASSDPAAKPKPKPKSRSTDDPKSSKDTDPSRGVAIMLLLGAPELEALGILDPAVIPTVTAQAMAAAVGAAADPSGMPLVSTKLPPRLFAPDNVCIPGRQQTRQYNIADVDPWVIQRINTLTITMTLEMLSRALPFRPEWIFPIDGRLGFLIERYSAVEFQDLIAFWESKHRFPVSSALIRSDPYLAAFVVERKNRRSHAGARWKQILRLFLIAMRESWCDLDLLLDPYFLHFPKRTDEVAWFPGIEARSAHIADPQLNRREPADLIEALAECDAADPWRTHYRQYHAGHPARRIARLAGKFFNMAAMNPNAPPLALQP
ncbi:hypothetical protein PHMEG_00025914, partial [Phytophthora megakarya]